MSYVYGFHLWFRHNTKLASQTLVMYSVLWP